MEPSWKQTSHVAVLSMNLNSLSAAFFLSVFLVVERDDDAVSVNPAYKTLNHSAQKQT